MEKGTVKCFIHKTGGGRGVRYFLMEHIIKSTLGRGGPFAKF